jgi:hypothetical protein
MTRTAHDVSISCTYTVSPVARWEALHADKTEGRPPLALEWLQCAQALEHAAGEPGLLAGRVAQLTDRAEDARYQARRAAR